MQIRRGTAAVALALSAALATACGSDSKTTSSSATFADVTANVMNPTSCGGLLCHQSVGGVAAGGYEVGTDTNKLYSELVNVTASGPKCGSSGLKRVVPGDPEKSLLYLKLSNQPPCGDAMPPGIILSDEKVEMIKSWIEAGAKND